MSESQRQVGSKLFLQLEIGEDLPGGFVSAFLYDQGNNFLGKYDLNYSSHGLFVESNAVMPNVTRVTAIYKVYEDAARTIINEEFPFVSENFVQDLVTEALTSFTPKGLTVTATVRKDSIVKTNVVSSKIIRGQIRESKTIVKGEIASSRIVGNLRTKTIIKGVVYDL